MVEFLTGLNAAGTLDTSDPNFWNWKGNNPATYTGLGFAHDWLPGSTVTYWFNTASNWTVSEQASFTDALNLWSAIANVHFVLSNVSVTPSNAIVITRGSDQSADTNTNYSFSNTLHRGLITGATVSIDTSVSSWWSELYSFSYAGGYGIQTVLHELGHALGLGHSGPYNGSVPSSSQVIYTTDNRQYSIMSYVDAGSATASAVATRNGDAPSPANYQNSNGTFYLTTPGRYDILAIQRLYGVASSGPLSTSETFGFNASAALTSSLPMFDFTINTNPVVTLYDSGTGNTLDLSDFSATSIVDLNPGQFSSVNGMVDNIGIDFSTWIDTAIGGAGNDTFYVNAQDDAIDGGGGTNTVVFSGDRANYTLSHSATQIIVSGNGNGITDTLIDVETLQFADTSVQTSSTNVACFARGTRLRTPAGEVPVEALLAGDQFCTLAGTARSIKWIGHRTINLLAHPHPPLAAPVRIQQGAFGSGRPERDLLLSPDHAVLVEDGALNSCLPAGQRLHRRPRNIDALGDLPARRTRQPRHRAGRGPDRRNLPGHRQPGDVRQCRRGTDPASGLQRPLRRTKLGHKRPRPVGHRRASVACGTRGSSGARGGAGLRDDRRCWPAAGLQGPGDCTARHRTGAAWVCLRASSNWPARKRCAAEPNCCGAWSARPAPHEDHDPAPFRGAARCRGGAQSPAATA